MSATDQRRADSCLQFVNCIGLPEAAKGLNFVFSPLSIRAALSLAAIGSKDQTLDQFLSFLGSPTVEDLNTAADRLLASVRVTDPKEDGGSGSILSFVNGVWIDQSLTLQPSFQEIATSIYNSVAKPVDFQRKILNRIYFKGTWAEKFDSSKTVDGDFHLFDGSKVQVPFMTSFKLSDKPDQYIASFDGFKVLKLPYKANQAGRNFSMLIFLPDQRDGLTALVQKAISSSSFLDYHVPTQKVEIENFMIPKFKISSGFDASQALQDLGLEIPFTSDADFTEMVVPQDGVKLFISSVHHKATIEVGEEGTEASAATAVMYELGCYRPPVDFIADHPFMFTIREDQSGALLFAGHVANPSL